MRLRQLLTLLLLLLASASARAQLAADTARGLVGEHIPLPIRLPVGAADTAATVTLEGTLRLSNPTVFFPELFLPPADDSVTAAELTQVQDSIYTFSVTLLRRGRPGSSGDTLVYLRGEALAGSDSLCVVGFENLRLDRTAAELLPAVVITRSVGPPLPYVRFAILEQNYPNPVPRGASTIWAYRIDKLSDVRFHIYNLMGQELEVFYLGLQGLGPHLFTYTPGITMPSGAYYIRLVTNSGSADKVMHIIH